MAFDPTLSPVDASAIVRQAGFASCESVVLLKRHNHVFRLICGDTVLFLKVYTKAWYGNDLAATAACVIHEQTAYAILEARGLPTVAVVLASTTMHNPLGCPFLLTRHLAGTSLASLLPDAEQHVFAPVLEAAGDYLRRVHAITFAFPGYLMRFAGPATPPAEGQWQHPLWSAAQTQRNAWATLRMDTPRLPLDLTRVLAERFATMDTMLAPAFAPPRFTHGDCHMHQFFLSQQNGAWHVTGFVDLEVASAGDCTYDLMKFAVEMWRQYSAASAWWEPLFAGYGGAPDFEAFRLRLLGWEQENFTAGHQQWSVTREQTLRHLLAAHDWATLFTAPVAG